MNTHTFIAEETKTTVLIAPSVTTSAQESYLVPTAGTGAVNLRAVVTMGNAADVVLTIKSADDATGTNATAFPSDVPLYINGAKQAKGKVVTIGDATGDFVVDFCVDPGLIPDGKFVGLLQGASNAANLISVTAIDNITEKPSA